MVNGYGIDTDNNEVWNKNKNESFQDIIAEDFFKNMTNYTE
jgi:hypothetical protein